MHSKGEIIGASPKICSVPENRNSSIFLMQCIANPCKFGVVFEHLDRSGDQNPSNRDLKIDVHRKGEIIGVSPKVCSVPENRKSSISLGKRIANPC